MQIESHNLYAEVELIASEVGGPLIDPIHAGMVQQVKLIGILLIVQALLEILMGGLMIALSFFIDNVFSLAGPADGPMPPKETIEFLHGMYFSLGIALFLASVMRFCAALGCFWFRGRTWIIVSLFAGLLSAFSGICGATSIGLCIYGLIVMFNPGVARAFQLVSEGRTAREIKQLTQGQT